MNKRTNLKIFRIKHDLTQEEMAARLHVPKPTYVSIELGLRNGNSIFWDKFQKEFKVKNADMRDLQEKRGAN